jgi:hypothetical protein
MSLLSTVDGLLEDEEGDDNGEDGSCRGFTEKGLAGRSGRYEDDSRIECELGLG